MLNYVKMVKFCEIWNSRVLLLLIIHMHGRRTWVGYDVCTQVDLRYRSVIHRTYSVSVQLVAYYVAIVSNIVIVTDYRVRQNKISQRESCDAYIMRARIFLNEIFHIYSSHTSWQVSLIVLSLLNVWWSGATSISALSTSCVWWYIAACTATHHLTWRIWSRRRPLQLSDLVSDLPHPVQSQYHELYRRSETGPPSWLLAHVHGTNFHHRFVAFTLLILLNVNLRHFYTITLLIYIVRRPCCVSALTSP